MGSGCTDSRFLDLGTSWSWVVSFTFRPLYPPGKEPTPPPVPNRRVLMYSASVRWVYSTHWSCGNRFEVLPMSLDLRAPWEAISENYDLRAAAVLTLLQYSQTTYSNIRFVKYILSTRRLAKWGLFMHRSFCTYINFSIIYESWLHSWLRFVQSLLLLQEENGREILMQHG
jgi:hypothetical protein